MELFEDLFDELGAMDLEQLDVDSLLERYDEDEDDTDFRREEIDFDDLEDGGIDPALIDVEMVGKTFWTNVSEFGDKTREIATEIILKYVQGTLGGEHTLATYVSRPMKHGELIDLDIDATIEARIQEPMASELTAWGFERQTTRNPVLLLLDTSFSMNGQKLTIAGITVGVLDQLLPSTDIAVIGFNKQPYVIKNFDEELSTYYMINRIMKTQPRGGTNLSDAMKRAATEIFPYHPHGRIIMLSDADPTAGKNPIPEASKLHTLDIMLFPDGNEFIAERLAFEAFYGNYYKIRKYEDIPDIIKSIFDM